MRPSSSEALPGVRQLTPTFSIITATRNRAELLDDAIQSVLAQDDVQIQHVVIDAASTDHTGAVLERHRHLEVRSEPDQGLYDAWNKGIDLAGGEIIGFLNDDDLLSEGSLASVARAFEATECDSVCGAAEIVSMQGDLLDKYPAGELTFDLVAMGPVITNARFFRRACFQMVGPFDPSLRVIGDREWLLRAWESGVTTTCIGDVVYRYREHAQAMTMNAARSGEDVAVDETLRVCEERLSREGGVTPVTLIKDWYSLKVGFAIVTSVRRGRVFKAFRLAWRARSVRDWPLRWVRYRRRIS